MTDAQLYAPFTHVASLKSKNIRDVFIDALNDVFHAGPAHVSAVKTVVQKLHNASLLLDDIEDSAPRRRGLPTAHTIFGIPLTMNAANLVVFDTLGDCVAIDKALPRGTTTAVEVFQQELVLLHRGQGQDIFWRDANQCPSLEEYRLMVQNKTGGLFRLALRLLALDHHLSSEHAPSALSEMLRIADQFGYYFQVLDDLMNLCSGDYHEQKCFCEDLTEGKFSFLTTHSVLAARDRGDERLLRVLRSRPSSVDVKLFCLRLMKETGTFDSTRQLLRQLAKEIEGALRAFPTGIDEGAISGEQPSSLRLVKLVHALESMIPAADDVVLSPSFVPGVPAGAAFEQALHTSGAAA